jgi:hypothetical protein
MTIVKETKLSSLDDDDLQNIVEHNITNEKIADLASAAVKRVLGSVICMRIGMVNMLTMSNSHTGKLWHPMHSDKRDKHIESSTTQLSEEDVNNTITNIDTAIMQLELLKKSILITEQVHKTAIKNANRK